MKFNKLATLTILATTLIPTLSFSDGFIGDDGSQLFSDMDSFIDEGAVEGYTPEDQTNFMDETQDFSRVGSDQRVKTNNVRVMPFSAVGRIKIGNQGICSGNLVGSNIVLTNGHCVFDTNSDSFYQNLTFSPGYQNGNATFGEIGVRRLFVHNHYKNQTKSGVDVGFLILNRHIGTTTGYFGTKGYDNSWTGENYWFLAGYGSNWVNSPFSTIYQTYNRSACKVHKILGGLSNSLFHDCDTGQGSSGSGLFGAFKNDSGTNDYLIVGVNYAGWGPRNDERMQSCSRVKVGSCGNLATNVSWFGKHIRELREKYGQ